MITGQIARLELQSKIERVVVPNLEAGHMVHLFLVLDNDIDHVHETQHYSNYIGTPFRTTNKATLRKYTRSLILSRLTETAGKGGDPASLLRVFVHIQPYRDVYAAINGPSLMSKMWNGNWSTDPHRVTSEARFDANMRMLTVIRNGMRQVQEAEFQMGRFYSLVVRIRDDSYFYGPWLFTTEYQDRFTSLIVNSFLGVNDHDFCISRSMADRFLRGLSEDYYLTFNRIGKLMKYSTEIYMKSQLNVLKVARREVDVCTLPSIPLRGPRPDTRRWRIHDRYLSSVMASVRNTTTGEKLLPCFREEWITALDRAATHGVDMEPEPHVR